MQHLDSVEVSLDKMAPSSLRYLNSIRNEDVTIANEQVSGATIAKNPDLFYQEDGADVGVHHSAINATGFKSLK